MEQIYVESIKTYSHGFILKEQDLRRIIDLINEQFKKISNDFVIFKFSIKYKNGAIASTEDIESVLKQDNEGSSSIIAFEINGEHSIYNRLSSIKLEFKNLDSDDDSGEKPIRHTIKGQSRDWVFVTSSLIEERISKMKRTQIDPSSSYGPGHLFYKLLSPIIMLIIMITTFTASPSFTNDSEKIKSTALSKIEQNYKNHQIKDPIDAIIQIERSKLESDRKINLPSVMMSMFLSKNFILVISLLILFAGFIKLFQNIIPHINSTGELYRSI